MKEIYRVLRPEVERAMRRRISIAEVNLLRKYEGRELIEDRIERQMAKLHQLWFKGIPR